MTFVVYTAEVILLLRILASAQMMLSTNYSNHVAVVFLVATCGVTAPMNLVGDLRKLIISKNRQNTKSEWGFGLLTFIQNTNKQTGGARDLK